MERIVRTKRGAEVVREGEEIPVDLSPERPEDPATEVKAGKRPGKPVVRKVKVSLALSEDFARLLGVVASALGVDQCELVERIMRPALKGCRQPTIPEDLKAMFGQHAAPAI